eukprot:gnl/MRDRNA2_/MRDRNA2_180481_c0_seq1.p1 gnl/MRDRNA2_/MRDRNA2_180481_c0~~gnl/MRDRNA2_/MRDRNA2_180481_c0_seq1.p1  ORF type:complete len:335 (+),score=55.15 gnl/MRDRNA2_/MRDRNA2_180481_c0_seq1:47-1006(+)
MGANIIIKGDLLGRCIGPAIAIYFYLGIGQILSAAIAAKYVPGGFTWAESWMIGIGMLGRAELFFVVLNIAYLENSIISEEMFFTLTLSAMMLNITVPIAISWYKPYYVGTKHMFSRPSTGKGAVAANKVSVVTFKALLDKATKEEKAAQRRIFKVKTEVNEVAPAKRRPSVDEAASHSVPEEVETFRRGSTAELITLPKGSSKDRELDGRRMGSKDFALAGRRGSKDNRRMSKGGNGSQRFITTQWTDIELDNHVLLPTGGSSNAGNEASVKDPGAVELKVEQKIDPLDIVPNTIGPSEPAPPMQAWPEGSAEKENGV